MPVYPPSQRSSIIRPPRQAAGAATSDNMYVIRVPHQDPLPAIPGHENIYAEPIPRPKIPLDDEDYLAPNPVRVESRESLDDQGYLRPNFDRFKRMDTSGSDREQSPPLIPPVSYMSGPI